jgi:hypothetical protein
MIELLTESEWDRLKENWGALDGDEQNATCYASYEDYCEETDNPISEDDWDTLHDEWGEVDTNALEHERYEHYRDEFLEGHYDGLASQAYEDAAYGRPDDPYYGPEYPIFRERDD